MGASKEHYLSKCTASHNQDRGKERKKRILSCGHSWKNFCGAGAGPSTPTPCADPGQLWLR